MDVIKALQYFISPDGPRMSIRTLSIYCGINESSLRDYIREKYPPPSDKRAQIEKGLSDMLKEMLTEWHL